MSPRSGNLVAAAVTTAALCVTTYIGPACLAVVIRDGTLAAVIVFCALGPGASLLDLLRLRDLPRRWRLILGIGLGLGLLSLAVLGLGVAGWMNRSMWLVVMGLCAAASGLELRRSSDFHRLVKLDTSPEFGHETSVGPQRWLWLLLALPAGLALAAASLPPGILWSAEGNGYDVLEYHLAVPKDYFAAGRISYLPHNIYSNFPFGSEMLYLLCMILRGDSIAAAPVAQMLNVLLAGLTVSAIWLTAREWSSRAGLQAAVVIGTCPMIVYLCGVAYVENAMLLFTVLAIAATVRARVEPYRVGRWWLIAGLCAGLACGCKYTAVACVAAPLLCVALVICHRGEGETGPRANRWRIAALFAVGIAIWFSPWMLKNIVYTGNPVFPLARNVFHERPGIWSNEAAKRWHDGHLPAQELQPMTARLNRLGSELVISPMFGPVIIPALLSLIILLARGSNGTSSARFRYLIASGVVAAFTLIAWLFYSHLYARFAVTILPPAVLCIAAAIESRVKRSVTASAIVLCIVTVNSAMTIQLFRQEGVFSIAALPAADRLDWFRQGALPGAGHVPKLNAVCEQGGRVLMIAEARTFYLSSCVDYTVIFNRSPFAEATEGALPTDAARWLVDQQYTYVYIGWSEWSRLSRSRYGFWPGLKPELIGRMTEAGLLVAEEQFYFAENQPPYGTLFRVVQLR